MTLVGSVANILDAGGSVSKNGGSAATVTLTGNALDRLGYGSAVVAYHLSLVLNAPATVNVAGVMKDCTTSGGTFADYSAGVATALAGVTGLNTWVVEENVNLRGAKRYVKPVVDVGVPASATYSISAVVVLGEADTNPC